jgi:hypothetical protein
LLTEKDFKTNKKLGKNCSFSSIKYQISEFSRKVLNFLDHGKSSPPGMNPGNPLSALEMTRLALFKMYNQAGLPHGPPPPGLPPGLGHAGLEMGRAMAEQQARAIQAVREAEHRAEKEKEAALAIATVAAAEKQRDREQRELVRFKICFFTCSLFVFQIRDRL